MRFPNPLGPGVLYVRESRSGSWLWTSIAGSRQSTGIRWPDTVADQREAKRLGMQILRERVDAHYNPKSHAFETSRRTIAEACALYLESVKSSLTEGMQRRYKSVVVHVIHRAAPELRNGAIVWPANPDFPLSYSALLERVEQKISSSPLDRRYLRKLIGLLPKFFDYWVERGWLDRSPANAISAPAARATQEDNRIWEQEAVGAMVAWADKQGRRPLSLLLRFLYRTGLRPIEVTRLRWEHVHDDHFEIDGKRGPHDAPRPRAFPLLDRDGNEWIPGLTSLLAELRVFEFDNDGYIFPWRNVKYMQRAFGICRDACGLHDGRSLYNFRKAAIWYWQEALKLPIEVTSALAGHRPDVNITHYRLKSRKREVQNAVTEARREPSLVDLPF